MIWTHTFCFIYGIFQFNTVAAFSWSISHIHQWAYPSKPSMLFLFYLFVHQSRQCCSYFIYSYWWSLTFCDLDGNMVVITWWYLELWKICFEVWYMTDGNMDAIAWTCMDCTFNSVYICCPGWHILLKILASAPTFHHCAIWTLQERLMEPWPLMNGESFLNIFNLHWHMTLVRHYGIKFRVVYPVTMMNMLLRWLLGKIDTGWDCVIWDCITVIFGVDRFLFSHIYV